MGMLANYGPKLDNLTVTCIGDRADKLKMDNLIFEYSRVLNTNIDVLWYDKEITDYYLKDINKMPHIINESVTLNKLWQDSHTEQDAAILYFHAKGITGIETKLKQGAADIIINMHQWRKFLEWGVIEKQEECLAVLKNGADTVGVNFTEWPVKHYSGNFWWAKSDYISRLASPLDKEWIARFRSTSPILAENVTPERAISEFWIGSGYGNMFSLYDHSCPPPKSNLYEELILRKEYNG
jgi:hypothetical protein